MPSLSPPGGCFFEMITAFLVSESALPKSAEVWLLEQGGGPRHFLTWDPSLWVPHPPWFSVAPTQKSRVPVLREEPDFLLGRPHEIQSFKQQTNSSASIEAFIEAKTTQLDVLCPCLQRVKQPPTQSTPKDFLMFSFQSVTPSIPKPLFCFLTPNCPTKSCQLDYSATSPIVIFIWVSSGPLLGVICNFLLKSTELELFKSFVELVSCQVEKGS